MAHSQGPPVSRQIQSSRTGPHCKVKFQASCSDHHPTCSSGCSQEFVILEHCNSCSCALQRVQDSVVDRSLYRPGFHVGSSGAASRHRRHSVVQRRGQESRDKTACTKNYWRLLAMGVQRGSVQEETIAVSATISTSVENDTVEYVSKFFHAAE